MSIARPVVAAAVLLCFACTPAPITPRSSGSVAVSQDDALLFVADADHDAIVVIDTARRQVLRQTKVARQPERVLVAPDGTVYVTSRGARTVSKLSAGAEVVEATATVGAEPVGLALSADGKRLLVANSLSSTISVLDPVTLTPLRELQVGGRPWALAESADGRRLFVTDFSGGALRVLDQDRGGERSLSLAQPPSAECAFGDIPSRTPAQAADVVLSPDGDRAYVAHVQSRTGADRGWNESLRLAVAPALSTVDTRSDAVQQDVARGAGPFGERVVSRADFPPALLSTNLDEGCQLVGGGNGMDAPSSLVVDGRGEWIFVADHNSNAVAVVSATGRTSERFRDPARGIADVVRVGARPTGIAVAGDLRHAWVHNSLDYSVSVIESRDGRLHEVAVIPFDRSPLPAAVERGRRLFYSAVDPRVTEPEFGGVSCSSCHPDGRTDALSWVLPTPGTRNPWRDEPTTWRQARNTPPLWGVTATAPYHWDGALADLPAFSRHMVSQMGGLGLASRDVEDLKSYLAVIEVPDNPQAGHLAPGLVARGEALFAERCSSCHAGELLTDGKAHVSSRFDLPRLDTPSLRGVFATAPYLHDGTAATLREVLTASRPTIGAHAQVGLPAADLEALEAFVLTR